MATGAPSAQHPAVPVRHRPSVTELTVPQLAELRAAFHAMQDIGDDRGYQYFAGVHGLPLPAWCDIYGHGKPTFLHWHRAYLWRFERALRATKHDVMLRWWVWVSTPAIPPAYGDPNTPDGQPNPLHLLGPPRHDRSALAHLAAQPPRCQHARQPGLDGHAAVPHDRVQDP